MTQQTLTLTPAQWKEVRKLRTDFDGNIILTQRSDEAVEAIFAKDNYIRTVAVFPDGKVAAGD